MALLSTGSLENVYSALDTYLTEELVTKAGLSLRLHGTRRFIPPVDDPWIEAHYDFLGLQSQFLRQTGGDLPNARTPGYDEAIYGTFRIGELQLNAYQRARVFRQRYTTARMRDIIVNAFPDSRIIPVYDVASHSDTGAARVGNIICSGVPTEQVLDDGMRSGVIQHVLRVQTRYIERYTHG